MTLPVSDHVQVTINVSANPPSVPSFSGGLILGDSARLSLGERVQAFNKDSYKTAFSSSDPEYIAAAMFFSQSPAPATVYIGRQFTSAQSGYLKGGVHSTLVTLKTITAGAFDISIDGSVQNVTALDLSGAADFAAIATLITAKLSGATCTYNSTDDVFVVTSATTGTSSAVLFATATVGDTTSASRLGLTHDDGGSQVTGIALEDMTAALDASKIASSAWYAFATVSTATFASQKLAADWGQANGRPYFVTTNLPSAYAAPVATSGDATDIAQYAHAKGYKYTFAMFSTDTLYAAISAMACLIVVDYNTANSVKTLKFKTLPGVGPEPLTETRKQALDAVNCNYYATFGSTNMLGEGWMSDGTFADQVIGLDWLKAEAEAQVFYVVQSSPTKIPQTNPGVFRIQAGLESALRKAVTNGLAAPGQYPVTSEIVGELQPGDYLEKGYYIYAQPVELQDLVTRGNRQSPPITAVLLGAGAIHDVVVTINFQP